ncbi:unnamed protein product [marine sediment metagenome]|uniref:Fido domain-containing protein n=1 Tax=marine sediment metagenome TaxID=412755 RepID=X0WFM8_9ZZZZ
MKIVTVSDVRFIAHRYAQTELAYDEPIPDFETRYPGILESCLVVPFQKFSGRDLYRGFAAKAAILFYLMTEGHPFQRGNKRIAMTTLFTFLYVNRKWLEVDTDEMYEFAVWVAASPERAKDEAAAAMEKFLNKYLVKLKET